jgi:predicted esterase
VIAPQRPQRIEYRNDAPNSFVGRHSSVSAGEETGMGRIWGGLIVVLLLPTTSWGQADRYELGQRLRIFEAEWMVTTSAEARARTVPPLKKTIEAFFTARVGEVARQLDLARAALRGPAASPAQQWAESLAIELNARLFDTGHKSELLVKLRPYYDSKQELPVGVSVRCRLAPVTGDDGPWTALPLAAVPAQIRLFPQPKTSGDWVVTVEIIHAGQVLAQRTQTVSLLAGWTERLQAVRQTLDQLPADGPRTTDRTTLKLVLNLLETLYDGGQYETDYPAFQLLRQAEELAAHLKQGKAFYRPTLAGQFWLGLPTSNTGTSVVRLLVPDKLDATQKVPLVIALHGAGGSENMFFEGYGAGVMVSECRQRGWLLAAPRAGTFINAAPVAAVVDELAKIYPVDPQRVYLVGHSMGAAQTIAALQAAPGKYTAAAALGGGGGVRKPETFKGVPLFVGVGTEDFALSGARSLAKAVEKVEGARVTLKEYPQVEHLMIVPIALKEVFAFFEQARNAAATKP